MGVLDNRRRRRSEEDQLTKGRLPMYGGSRSPRPGYPVLPMARLGREARRLAGISGSSPNTVGVYFSRVLVCQARHHSVTRTLCASNPITDCYNHIQKSGRHVAKSELSYAFPMSTTVKGDITSRAVDAKNAVSTEREVHPAHWKGFVAGVFSGVAKLTGEISLVCTSALLSTDFS